MKIERAVLREVPLRLREPFEISSGVTHDRRIVLLTLHADGLEGWGECVAGEVPAYSSETTDTAWLMLTRFILPSVVGRELTEPGDLLAGVGWMRGHRMAKAAVEMAGWDLRARAEGRSLSAVLGGTRTSVPVGVSVGLKPVVEYAGLGYRRIKIKIKPGRDVAMLAEVRNRFPELPLMADANSAYTMDDLPALRALDDLGLTMIEQPLAHDDFLHHARLQEQLKTAVCLDESVASEGDLELALALKSCRVLNIKPGRVGGLAVSRRLHDVMRSRSLPVWCGGMLESGVGRAHNVALASLPGFTLPGDISSSRRYWERDLVHPEFEIRPDGEMAVPEGLGIGVDVDVELVERLKVREAVFGG